GRRHGGTVRRPACRWGKPRRRIRSMRHHPAACCLVATLLSTVVFPGLAPASGRAGQGTLRGEFLERDGGLRVEGRLAFDPGTGFGFAPAVDQGKKPLHLEAGTVVSFPSSEPQASSLPP